MSDLGVLVTTDVFPPDCGGSGWSAAALVRGLLERGHRVEVVELDPGADGVGSRRHDDVAVTTLGLGRWRTPLRRLRAREYSFRPVHDFVRRRLREEPGLSLVHAQHLHSGPGALVAARSEGRGGVLTVRDHWPVCLHGTVRWGGRECPGCRPGNLVGCMNDHWGLVRPAAALMVPWARRRLGARAAALGCAHRLVFPSQTLRERIEARLGALPAAVVPNVVDADRCEAQAASVARTDDPLTDLPGAFLLAAGKLNRDKGFDRLVEWLGECPSRLPLVVAGSGPLDGWLRSRCRELDVELFVTGWIDGPRLARLMQGAAALALPSRVEEALARTLLEAMAVGTPVVSWPLGSSREVIEDGHDGWIVGSSGELEKVLSRLRDPGTLKRVSAAAQKTARKRFGPQAVIPRMETVYREVLEEAAR